MTRFLWAIEGRLNSQWILLPNIIMTTRRDIEFELKELLENPRPYIRFRIVKFERVT
jgi:hypothetical protein